MSDVEEAVKDDEDAEDDVTADDDDIDSLDDVTASASVAVKQVVRSSSASEVARKKTVSERLGAIVAEAQTTSPQPTVKKGSCSVP